MNEIEYLKMFALLLILNMLVAYMVKNYGEGQTSPMKGRGGGLTSNPSPKKF